eukprot:TRINITY_DN3266_c2_g1_i1.p1 TRINITY_DN3266_c2_g1~~TRINITY_DN3266_c2_g1_i1.p1  ORF type:complete len:166 (-),score=4.10 TRINITY_DN3266_c2_g1_i1:75-572(-)
MQNFLTILVTLLIVTIITIKICSDQGCVILNRNNNLDSEIFGQQIKNSLGKNTKKIDYGQERTTDYVGQKEIIQIKKKIIQIEIDSLVSFRLILLILFKSILLHGFNVLSKNKTVFQNVDTFILLFQFLSCIFVQGIFFPFLDVQKSLKILSFVATIGYKSFLFY